MNVVLKAIRFFTATAAILINCTDGSSFSMMSMESSFDYLQLGEIAGTAGVSSKGSKSGSGVSSKGSKSGSGAPSSAPSVVCEGERVDGDGSHQLCTILGSDEECCLDPGTVCQDGDGPRKCLQVCKTPESKIECDLFGDRICKCSGSECYCL